MTFLKIGHRGCMALEPENTMRGFERAIKMGVDYVEFDVHLSSDNHLVVIHDKEIDRTTNGKGLVKDLTKDELKKLDAGKKESIPTLKEVLERFKGRTRFVIELKADHTTMPVVTLLQQLGIVHDVIIISFFHRLVKEAKTLCPEIQTGILVAGCPIHPSNLANDAKADYLFAAYQHVDRDMMIECHAAGLKVIACVIRTTEELDEMKELGADGIPADDPRLYYD